MDARSETAPTLRRSRQVPATARRDEIAWATAETIARCGLAGTSLREIAARLGTSVGVLTHQFRDRDQLLLYAFDTIADELLDRARMDIEEGDVRRGIERGLAYALPLDDRSRVVACTWLAFASAATTSPTLAAAYAARLEIWVGGLAALVTRVTDRPDVDPTTTASLLLAVADGIALRALATPAAMSPDRQRVMLHAAVEAILRPAGPSR